MKLVEKSAKYFLFIIQTILTIAGAVTVWINIVKDTNLLFIIAIIFCALIWVLRSHVTKLFKKIFQPGKIKWFMGRDEATPDMKKEMLNHSELIFLGISQTQLAQYLCEILENYNGTLNWKHITVYFAKKEIGLLWEKNLFHPNICRSRQEISATLFAPQNKSKIPNLETLTFKQGVDPLFFGGCMFGKSESVFDTMYIVHYLSSQTQDTKKSLTQKLIIGQDKDCEGEYLRRVYQDAQKYYDKYSKPLGTFTSSFWDVSIREWKEFIKGYEGMKTTMSHMVDISGLKGNESVMEIASGTGDLSNFILEKIPQGDITFFEASPIMLQECKANWGGINNRVHFALGIIGKDECNNIVDLMDKKFDVLFCHQALSNIAGNTHELSCFVKWCKYYLKHGGAVIVNGHNRMVQLEIPEYFAKWKDPFYIYLSEIVKNHKLENCIRGNQSYIFTINEIEDVFKKEGFCVEKRTIEEVPFSMADRILMWRTPAVLNSFLNIKGITIDEQKAIIDELSNLLINFETMPRYVVTWKFQLST